MDSLAHPQTELPFPALLRSAGVYCFADKTLAHHIKELRQQMDPTKTQSSKYSKESALGDRSYQQAAVGTVRHFTYVKMKRLKRHAVLRSQGMREKAHPVLHRTLLTEVAHRLLFFLVATHQELTSRDTNRHRQRQAVRPPLIHPKGRSVYHSSLIIKRLLYFYISTLKCFAGPSE